MKYELEKEQKSTENNTEKESSSLILRPREGFPLIRSEENRMTLSRRRFIAASAAATAGAIWLQPLHVDAKDKWWRTLLSVAATFAEGLFFKKFGGSLPFLQNINFGGLKPIEGQDGLYGILRPPPFASNAPAGSELNKLLRYVHDNGQVKGALAYIQKVKDQSGKWVDQNNPILYIAGQMLSAYAFNNGQLSNNQAVKVVESLSDIYLPPKPDNKAEFFLPQLSGTLPYNGGASLGPLATNIANTFLMKTPGFNENHSFVHITEGGGIIVQEHTSQERKPDGRGQANTTIYIVPSRDSDPSIRLAHKKVAGWMAKPENANFWATEKKKQGFLEVVKKNLAFPAIESFYEYGAE